MYAHEETMEELEITSNELPKDIKSKIVKFNSKKRMSSRPETLSALESQSEDIADEILEWFNEQDFEEEEEEEEPEPVPTPEPAVVVPEPTPIPEPTPNVVSHVKNEEIEEEEPKEGSNGGWGINTNW